MELTGPECDDAADWVVWRHANGYAIAGNDLDPETTHAAAQLGEHFMARVTLHTIEAAGVNGNHRALHVDQIVFAQRDSNQEVCHITPSRATTKR